MKTMRLLHTMVSCPNYQQNRDAGLQKSTAKSKVIIIFTCKKYLYTLRLAFLEMSYTVIS